MKLKKPTLAIYNSFRSNASPTAVCNSQDNAACYAELGQLINIHRQKYIHDYKLLGRWSYVLIYMNLWFVIVIQNSIVFYTVIYISNKMREL